MKELRLLPGVFDDTAQAARWYDEEGYEGLGDRFVDNFYSYLDHIQVLQGGLQRVSPDIAIPISIRRLLSISRKLDCHITGNS